MRLKKILLGIMLLFMVIPVVNAVDEDTKTEDVLEEEIYLNDILLDGQSIEGFSKTKYVYEIKVDDSVKKVQIGAPFDKDKFTVTTDGSLTYEVKPGVNEFKITVLSKATNKKQEYTLKFIKNDSRSNDGSLSSLTVGGQEINLKDDVFEYTAFVPNSTKSVEITATIKDNKASFIQGYGERIGNNAVSLSGETTNIELKVKAENEEIKTYKITIKKTDYKNNDATLKTLTIKDVNFNFNSNITSYDIEVENNIDKVSIEAIPNNDKATANYNKEISLNEGLNKVTIQVTAEDGTEKSYRLNITRKEKVNLVEKIEIEGIDLEFQSDVYEYDIETTLTTLNFTVSLTDKNATYEVLDNEDLKDGSVVSLVIKNGNEELTYKFKIINEDSKEEEVVITDKNEENEEKKEENVGFLKKNEMLIGLLTFGVGLISSLFAFLTKFKNK